MKIYHRRLDDIVGRTAVATQVVAHDAPVRRTRPEATVLGLVSGQIAAAQTAVVLVGASAAIDLVWLTASVPLALMILIITFGRVRRRWMYQWLGQRTRYRRRRVTLPTGASALDFLHRVRPQLVPASMTIDETDIGIVEDVHGLTAILEIGNTTTLFTQAGSSLPNLGSLLPSTTSNQPVVRLQLVLTGVAAPTLGVRSPTAANSYRQLTDGRIPSEQRVLIAVHVRRSNAFDPEDLRRVLASTVRRVRRRLDRDRLPFRALAGDSALQTLAELAHHDPACPVQESWSSIAIGRTLQTCLQVTRWPDPNGELTPTFISRLITLPGGSTTTSLTIEAIDDGLSPVTGIRAEFIVRLASTSPAGLSDLIGALTLMANSSGARIRPLDGRQMAALSATLPLGGTAGGLSTLLTEVVAGYRGTDIDGSSMPVTSNELDSVNIPVGGAGLMVGVNRHGAPVTIRLFRPEPTRSAVIGGIRCAQIIVLRALAIGADTVIMSGRPQAWEPFLRGVCAQGAGTVGMVPPSQVLQPPPASPTSPQLLVIDVGPVGTTGIPVVEAPWRTTLLVRDSLTHPDIDILARMDLALLQPLTLPEAQVASTALGIGESANWLTRIRADMIGVVVGRRTLRWALISATHIEQQLIGLPTR